MANPLNGATATITSVTATTDLKYLIDMLKVTELTLNIDADETDISELSGSGSAAEKLSGLMSGTASFSGLYPKSAPLMGNTGLVTYNGTAVAFVTDWSMDVDFGEQEITAFDGTTPPTVKQYMPSGIFTWGGGFNATASGAAAPALPAAANATGVAAIFQLFKGATNNHTLSGSINYKTLGHTIRKADKQTLAYTYSGSGTLTETQGDTYDPLRVAPASSAPGTATAWPVPSFDLTALTPSIVITTSSTGPRSYTIKAYLKSIRIAVNVGQPITITGTLRIFGPITTA